MSAVDLQLFKPELAFPHFAARNRYDLFDQLEQVLSQQGYIHETWHAGMLEREEHHPTGLNCGTIQVAIPHVDSKHIAKPYIAVLKLDRPIEFEGMGGTPAVQAQLVINIGLLGHEDSQIKVLQALMQLFLDVRATADIMAQGTSEGLLKALRRHIEALEDEE